MDEELSEHEQAAAQMRELEEADELPRDLSEWPDGKAKYITFGEDSDEPYGEGPTAKLGPAEVAHHEDGSVTVAGEQADPEDFKGERISSAILEQTQSPEDDRDGES